jgi:galactokinase
VARKREDRKLRFYSLNFEHLGIIESSLDDLKPYKEAGWTNYPKGVMWAFGEMGMKMGTGMDLMLYGNIPNGSGLSSSASVEILTGYILRDLYGFHIDNRALALIGQFSENKFNGVNCGIMDQFAIAMGKKDHAIFLDTNTLEYQLVPIKLDGVKIIIACSNKKRGLGDSKYNERRSECEQALEELQKYIDIKSLGDLLEDDFEIYKSAINSDIRKKRAKHAVYENRRTMKAVDALVNNDIATFGQLMNASHVSLRDDYEVTGVELDEHAHNAALQNIARNGLSQRMDSIHGDLRGIKGLVGAGSFQVCVSNPPYFQGGPAAALKDARREDCCSSADLFAAAAWALKFGGDLFLVHRPERLAQLCAEACAQGLEPKRLGLLRHKEGGPVALILLHCRKGAKPGLIWEELCLHHADGSPTDFYRCVYHL